MRGETNMTDYCRNREFCACLERCADGKVPPPLQFHRDAFAMVWPQPRRVVLEVLHGYAYFGAKPQPAFFALLNMPGAE